MSIPRPLPTGRGLTLLVLAVLLGTLGIVTGLYAARAAAVVLALALLVGLLAVLLGSGGRGVRRQLREDAVEVGEETHLQLTRTGRAPWGRLTVRQALPQALGGPATVPLVNGLQGTLPVRHRGIHPLGAVDLDLHDPWGLWRMRRRVPTGDDAVIGLPRWERISEEIAAAAGIARRDGRNAAAPRGGGEIGTFPRPYVPGDDIRRIHWRATARTGSLMTREDEPAEADCAVIMLDTRRSTPADDRLVELTASLLETLRTHAWTVHVLDAGGEEITRAEPRSGRQGSPLGGEVDAVAVRRSRIALAQVGFAGETPGRGRGDLPVAGALGTGAVLAVAVVAAGAGRPDADGLDIDQVAGRSARRWVLVVDPATPPDGPVEVTSRGRWAIARLGTATSLAEALRALSSEGV
ncbi:DUF58 domain-containing protein [Brachybacterium sp. EF45031]|uniref:DUF58 domain-containing protein n=1 Tax=Brachybacterium sillae TaxID=2810536 RepID=UPI00217DD6F2|nr:DUF58 domain-containing protein [Brachybacterium sillae]MCS6711483.1 DUF58 domain-containing protein [Brachybacterium sillae]